MALLVMVHRRDAENARESNKKFTLCVLRVSACPMKSFKHLFHRGGERWVLLFIPNRMEIPFRFNQIIRIGH